MSFQWSKDKRYFRAPCGQCLGCRADQALQWSIRCLHEASLYEQNSFLTLTFDDDHVTDVLSKKPLQDFFKRFRRDGTPLRYFACGEYGGLTHRPHYHVLVFGHDFLERGKREKLERNWSNGFVSVDPVELASVMYVCGYTQKKVEDKNASWATMSRDPGIGRDYLAQYSKDMERSGFVVVGGQKMPIPRRYKQWFEPLKATTADYMLGESSNAVSIPFSLFSPNTSGQYKPKDDSSLRARAAKAIADLRAAKLREKI